MVTFEEVDDSSSPPENEVLPSQSRLLDAEAIEEAAKNMKRISARMHLESLAKKLRKESEALKRVEKSKATLSKENESDNAVRSENTANTTDADEKKTDSSLSPSTAPSPLKKPTPVAVATATTGSVGISPSAKFTPVDRFSFDAGDYNSPFVTIYVALPGVGSISRDLVTCDFTKSSFDLIVRDLNGKSHRLFKDDLEHDIDETKSKIIVKADKVLVKLAKVKKGEYGGFDYWTKLTDKKGRNKTAAGGGGAKDNPQDSIMKLMKDMYDEGDDNMKKVIGETMMKQQRGELNRPPDMSTMGGGLGGGDLGGDLGGFGEGLGDTNLDENF